MGHTVPAFLAWRLSFGTVRHQLLTGGTVTPTVPLAFPACAEHSILGSAKARLGQSRGTGFTQASTPVLPTHQFPQSFCSTVPGGKKLPPHSQGQADGSMQIPPEIRAQDSRVKGTYSTPGPAHHHGLVALSQPWCPLPLAFLTTHHAAESLQGKSSPPHRRWPGSAIQAQHGGYGMWEDRWGHRPRTLVPLHIAGLGGEREAQLTQVQGHQVSQPKVTPMEGTGRMSWTVAETLPR